MAGLGKILLRSAQGDVVAQSAEEVKGWYTKGRALPGDFLYDYSEQSWHRLAEHPFFVPLFAEKPRHSTEKRVIYFYNPLANQSPVGPFSVREIQDKVRKQELSDSSWILVEGDKEWRQVRGLKALAELLPPLPVTPPEPVAGVDTGEISLGTGTDINLEMGSDPAMAMADLADRSIKLDVNTGEMQRISAAPKPAPAPPKQSANPFADEEEPTKAFSMLGLSLDGKKDDGGLGMRAPAPPKPTPPPTSAHASRAGMPVNVSAPNLPGRSAAPIPREAVSADKAGAEAEKESGSYDGITAEIPTEPIWLIKQASSEAISGPFRFLQVVKFLEQGKLTKNDKISKVGTNRFVKILQQYEFNVSYSLENVVENGVEKQKIFIRRRHPRVPYITGVQISSKHGAVAANCINISAGGILIELPKAEFNLGDILDIRILPGAIPKAFSCRVLVIGRIPKIPPGFALKFEDLKPEDKEVIEHFVQEALRREMGK